MLWVISSLKCNKTKSQQLGWLHCEAAVIAVGMNVDKTFHWKPQIWTSCRRKKNPPFNFIFANLLTIFHWISLNALTCWWGHMKSQGSVNHLRLATSKYTTSITAAHRTDVDTLHKKKTCQHKRKWITDIIIIIIIISWINISPFKRPKDALHVSMKDHLGIMNCLYTKAK